MNEKNFRIPKETEILSRRVKILWNTPRVIDNRLYGCVNIASGEIHLAEKVGTTELPLEEIEITYLHEVSHLILAKNGYESKIEKAGIDLEQLVEDLAVGVYQAITKGKYN